MAKIDSINHHARIATSPRLKKLLNVLSDLEWHSTAELTERCRIYCVSSAISELRSNGIAVASRRRKMPLTGLIWWEFRLGRT